LTYTTAILGLIIMVVGILLEQYVTLLAMLLVQLRIAVKGPSLRRISYYDSSCLLSTSAFFAMDLEDKILKFSLATDLKDDIRHDEEDRYIFQFSQQPRATPYYLHLLLRSGSECDESTNAPGQRPRRRPVRTAPWTAKVWAQRCTRR